MAFYFLLNRYSILHSEHQPRPPCLPGAGPGGRPCRGWCLTFCWPAPAAPAGTSSPCTRAPAPRPAQSRTARAAYNNNNNNKNAAIQSKACKACVWTMCVFISLNHPFIFASLSFHYRFENVQQSLMNNIMTYRHASQAATQTYQQLDHLDNPPCCWRPNKRKLVFTDTDSDSHLYVQDCPVSLCRRYKG